MLALFQEVRERRKDEYAWEPDGWTPALEAKYRKWESQQKLADKVADDVAGQGDAITREWLLQEQGRIESSAMTAEEIVHVTDLMQEYQPHMPAGVEAKDPCHLVYLVEEAARKAVPDDPVKFIGAVSGILNDIIREAGK